MAVLPRSSLQLGRVLQARHLHQDTVGALPLDHRLDRAELVDAALDDLDRLFDGLADALGNGRLRHRQADQPAAGIADLKAALAAGAEQTAERLRQLAQLCQGRRQLGISGDAHFDGVIARIEAGIADLGVAQRAANVVTHLIELLFLDVVGIDLQQQIGAALQIEAKHQMTLRPDRPASLPSPRGKKFGTAQRHTTSAVRMIASAFHRVKYNIELTRQVLEWARSESALARRTIFLGGISFFLGRLALGAHARNHLPHLPHADAVRDLELDLVVVDHFCHFAD